MSTIVISSRNSLSNEASRAELAKLAVRAYLINVSGDVHSFVSRFEKKREIDLLQGWRAGAPRN